MNKNILCVTTFNRKLYDASARFMLDSWFDMQCQQEADLMIYEEDNLDDELVNRYGHFAKIRNLHLDFWRKKVLNANKDIMDVKYGGKKKDWPAVKTANFNKEWPRFFNKVVALRQAVLTANKKGYEYVLMIDCDLKVKKTLRLGWVESLFGKNDFVYLLGHYRKKVQTGIEAGFVGFKAGAGFELAKHFWTSFEDGSFREFPRWDDGHVLRTVHEMHPEIKSKDLVFPNHKVEQYCPVFKYSYIREFFNHYKGTHGRVKKVV